MLSIFRRGKTSRASELAMLAANRFEARGHAVKISNDTLCHTTTHLTFRLALQEFKKMSSGFRTVTTIETSLAGMVPPGVFEFQHSTGDSVAASIAKGIDLWLQIDFPVLVDALSKRPSVCMFIEMPIPASSTSPARLRRAVLGPIEHYHDGPKLAGSDPHPFCSCCFLTQNMAAFKPLIDSDRFCAIRMFSARNPDGSSSADCRVNGLDFDKGAEQLRLYADTWLPKGYEYRKQYVVLQTIPVGGASV